jgi:tetratricopeptide (TPR) repeat protein
MKKLFIVCFISILSLGSYAQDKNAWLLQAKEYSEKIKTSSDEEREYFIYKLESILHHTTDSLMKEGMYMTALEMIVFFNKSWVDITGNNFPIMLYLKKGMLYSFLDDWGNAVKTTQECLSVHKNSKDTTMVFIYEFQGRGYKQLKDYNNAIIAYENALSYFIKNKNVGKQGSILYDLGHCYSENGNKSLAASFYEKGFNKSLEYFNTTRSALLKSKYIVNEGDERKKSLLDIFSNNLAIQAVLEIERRNLESAYEYLKMSANCGNEKALEFIQENF